METNELLNRTQWDLSRLLADLRECYRLVPEMSHADLMRFRSIGESLERFHLEREADHAPTE